MALTLVGSSTDIVFGTTSSTPGTIASTQSGDVGYIFVASKRSGSGTQPSPPTNWTELLNVEAGATGGSGADNGPVRIQVFKRVSASNDLFSTMPAVTRSNTTGAVIATYARVWRPGAGEAIEDSVFAGSDTSAGTAYSITTSSPPGLATGDQVELWTSIAHSTITFGTTTISASGATFSSRTEVEDAGTENGDDIRAGFHSCNITAGSSNSNVTFGITLSSSSAGGWGGTAVLRLRAVTLTTSAYPGVRRARAARLGAFLNNL